jgi:hypothetical protein
MLPGQPQSPMAHMFVYPEMMCNGKRGVTIAQPIGTVTIWKASLFEHTSSVDELPLLKSLKGISDENEPLSVGLVVVQQRKLFTVPSNCSDVVSELYSTHPLSLFCNQISFACRRALKTQKAWPDRRMRREGRTVSQALQGQMKSTT